jgi:sodium-coupled neutral amino acid transporter 11
MFAANSRAREAKADGEARQPLLNDSHEDVSADEPNQVVFSIPDDEDSESSSAAEGWSDARRAHSGVRFQEEVQVIGPPLRSTTQSREAGACLLTHNINSLLPLLVQSMIWTLMTLMILH